MPRIACSLREHHVDHGYRALMRYYIRSTTRECGITKKFGWHMSGTCIQPC
jgi:hypothetical protein